MQDEEFLLVVITTPVFFPGEAACLEGLLAAGLEKLHLRKPGASEEEMEALLGQIAPRWHSRIVLHHHAEGVSEAGRISEAGRGKASDAGRAGGSLFLQLAARYGIPQIHCPLKELRARDKNAIAVSSSLHSWEEMKTIGEPGPAYVFMSPVFDSISKPGYSASPGLLRRPARPYPCKVVGLGGVDKDNIRELIREDWDGAAVLGWIWEEPGAAVERYEQLKKIIAGNCP